MGILFRWFILTIAIWAATLIVPGVHFEKTRDLLIAALVLGILNAFVKPLLRLISLPFIILTFGFFLLVINGLLLVLTAKLVHGFHVDGFWPAVWASLVVSLVSFFLGYSKRQRRPRQRIIINQPPPYHPPPQPQGPPPGK
ncbi:MAG: phage holin family protein, partial [bacterium]